ncbi:MAG TPA: [LysW]-aminoadipate/[LysW]-glutamate kinase [Candidatus Binatus sp.]|nr:[LysW]-aminoadipate/[LysW]-glutamate kinase [Candidatus Binatus sp.]
MVKLGGDIITRPSPSLFTDLRGTLLENKVILVHGGGDEVTEIADRLGKPQSFVVSPGGIRSRFTDETTSKIYTMVMCGKNNKELVAALQREKIPAFGFSGVDGGAIRAERKKRLVIVEAGRKRIVDGGFTGQIKSINHDLLDSILRDGYVPVIAPVALGDEYEFLNVDSDRAAAYVAGGVHAERIIFLTDVKGIFLDNNLVRKLKLAEGETTLKKVGFGMEKKLLAGIEAVRMGVDKAIIASGTVDMPIQRALTGDDCTVITK